MLYGVRWVPFRTTKHILHIWRFSVRHYLGHVFRGGEIALKNRTKHPCGAKGTETQRENFPNVCNNHSVERLTTEVIRVSRTKGKKGNYHTGSTCANEWQVVSTPNILRSFLGSSFRQLNFQYIFQWLHEDDINYSGQFLKVGPYVTPVGLPDIKSDFLILQTQKNFSPMMWIFQGCVACYHENEIGLSSQSPQIKTTLSILTSSPCKSLLNSEMVLTSYKVWSIRKAFLSWEMKVYWLAPS